MKIITDERCLEYSDPPCPERPDRVRKALAKLRSPTSLKLDWAAPLPLSDEVLLRAHERAFLDQVKNPPAKRFDSDTAALPGIFDHASRSVGGALAALQHCRAGEVAFSLMRPPGHHATPSRAMGFCFLNQAAVVALEAKATGAERVAVFDFDVHHGNGTEDILLDRPGMGYYSVHQSPCYPGTGREHRGKNCFNYPVAPRVPREEYRQVLSKALENLKKYAPDLVVVSAGFDAYVKDTIARENLEIEDYQWLGKTVRQLDIPALHLLEGGYSEDLPELIFAYLSGLQG